MFGLGGREMRLTVILSMLVSGVAPGALSAEAEDGAAVFQQACARCHRHPSEVSYAFEGAEAAAEMDAFLTRHHARDPEMRAALIAWFLAQISE